MRVRVGVPSSELLLPAPLLCPQQVAGPGLRRLCPPGSPALGSPSRVARPRASPPRLPETTGATSLRHSPALGPLRARVLSHPLCGGRWRVAELGAGQRERRPRFPVPGRARVPGPPSSPELSSASRSAFLGFCVRVFESLFLRFSNTSGRSSHVLCVLPKRFRRRWGRHFSLVASAFLGLSSELLPRASKQTRLPGRCPSPLLCFSQSSTRPPGSSKCVAGGGGSPTGPGASRRGAWVAGQGGRHEGERVRSLLWAQASGVGACTPGPSLCRPRAWKTAPAAARPAQPRGLVGAGLPWRRGGVSDQRAGRSARRAQLLGCVAVLLASVPRTGRGERGARVHAHTRGGRGDVVL